MPSGAELVALSNQREQASRDAFSKYDQNGNGLIDKEELRYILADLGMLDGMPAAELGVFLDEEFAKADLDGSGELDFQEFTKYYNSVQRFRNASNNSGSEEGSDLHQLFLTFASFGSSLVVKEMDGSKFAKLCKDTKIVAKGFTTTDVDIIYAKAKNKGERKITYKQFLNALTMVAEKKGLPLEKLFKKVVDAGGPSSSGTVGEYNKFHDDKSTYTGVYSRGGPTKIDTPGGHAQKLQGNKFGSGVATIEADIAAAHAGKKKGMKEAMKLTETDRNFPPNCLVEAFEAFSNFGMGKRGSSELDGAKFFKCIKDAGLTSKKFTSTSVDIIFSKVKAKGQRKIGYKEFEIAVQMCAEELVKPYIEVVHAIQYAAPSQTGVTQAEYNKFHDDKSTYTGVYARGGPTNVDYTTGASISLDKMVAGKK